jgi:hypothetical protein
LPVSRRQQLARQLADTIGVLPSDPPADIISE